MSDVMPRFRGHAFEVENGWEWEIFVSMLGSNEGDCYQSKNTFPTKQDAIDEMTKIIKSLCDEVQMKVMGHANGNYIDMKTNETMNWNKEGYN